MRERDYVGFAHVYFQTFDQKSDSNARIDIKVYKKLVEIDTKLGTTASEQLLLCLAYTNRLDIMKVRFYDLNISFEMI